MGPTSVSAAEAPLPSCNLFDLVLDMNWEAVQESAERFPRDAQYQDGDSFETPLYLACQHNPPVEAVRALIRANPSALLCPSKNGDVPLLCACRYTASAAVIQLLVDSNTSATRVVTKRSNTALMALCNANEPDEEERWHKLKIVLEGVARSQQLFRVDVDVDVDGEASDARPSPLFVHAAVSMGSLGCPKKVLHRVLSEYPEQIQVPDQWGRLPFHLSIRSTRWLPELRRRYKPRERHTIVQLLKKYPVAAQIPHRGRLALHIAVANGHTWSGGVENIFQLRPDAGLIADEETELMPFQLAAIPVGDSQASLDTVFELLVAQPHALRTCLARSRRRRRNLRDGCFHSTGMWTMGYLERIKDQFPTLSALYAALAVVAGSVAVWQIR